MKRDIPVEDRPRLNSLFGDVRRTSNVELYVTPNKLN